MTKHPPDQIITKLRAAEVELALGLGIGQVCQKLAISEQTFHRWRAQYGGLKADEAKRLNELEAENARLKRLVAELAIDKQMLQEAVQKKKHILEMRVLTLDPPPKRALARIEKGVPALKHVTATVAPFAK